MSTYQARAGVIGQQHRAGDEILVPGEDVVVVGAPDGYTLPDVVTILLIHGRGPDGWLVSAYDPQQPGVRLSIRVADLDALAPGAVRLVSA